MKRSGRPLSTTQDARFAASIGHPTVDNTEMNVPIGHTVNPGPGCHVECSNCYMQVHIRKKVCGCGFRLVKKRGTVVGKRTGQPLGTTQDAGFVASTGHPTADNNIEMNVLIGRPFGSTRDAGFSASIEHPTADVDIELNVPTGRPLGTTKDAGFSASAGRPDSTVNPTVNLMEEGYHEYSDSTSMFIEENLSLLNEYMKQYDLPKTWNTDILSMNDSLLARAKKCIG